MSQAQTTAPSPATPQSATPQPAPTTPPTLAPIPDPVITGGPYSAAEMYEAAQVHRQLVRDQLSSLENQRDEIAQQLRQPGVTGADQAGLEARLRLLDTQILNHQQQLADARLREAQAAALPGSTQQSERDAADDRFEMLMVSGTIITLVLGFPLVVAQARRLWKKHGVVASMTPQLDSRLETIERAVEATALEVERIGEGQRFVTQLMAKNSEARVKEIG